VTISDELKAEGSRSMVPMALQMLVENAVKHNIISSQKPLEIEIGINNNYIFIQNNLQRKESLESSNGIGLENIRSRYIMLSGKDIIITDNGTYFRVELPIIQES
jgi:LytS/YehU family sensor histidine kinase